MRYYVIDVKGTVHADTDSREKAEALLSEILAQNPEYKDLELEIVTDADEEDLAAELREMASLGWEKQEAYESKEAFFERLGEVGEGFTEEEVFQTWENVWEQISDEVEGPRYWLDMGTEMTLYKKPVDDDDMDEEVWSGTMEEAGTCEGDPNWQDKLDAFFDNKFGIKAEEWEIG